MRFELILDDLMDDRPRSRSALNLVPLVFYESRSRILTRIATAPG